MVPLPRERAFEARLGVAVAVLFVLTSGVVANDISPCRAVGAGPDGQAQGRRHEAFVINRAQTVIHP